ncbi:MAG TPA: YkgJ family cysteine cluster protein [Gemmataceae bacterium]|nr:YkgJ family cysteine cluster protein [Gemmataceae bacterium]
MSEPWYADGLRFACTRCGHCCTGAPGFVWINDDEVRALAAFRGEPFEVVLGLYTRREGGTRRSLKEKANGDCVFYDREQGCTVYPVRPRQCRTWPFWECNADSPSAWARAAADCPGMNHGTLIPVEEITRRVKVIRI